MHLVLGLHGKVLVVAGRGRRGTPGMASVKSCLKLSLCLQSQCLTAPRQTLLLAKAKYISDGDSTSGITYLRREEKPAV